MVSARPHRSCHSLLQEYRSMKVGIVGSGLVGSTAAYALVMQGIGREIVLVDLNRARVQAEADDILHAVPFAHPLRIAAGDYSDLAGCRVVILSAGVNQRPGETRLELLARNAAVFRDVVPRVLEFAANAVLVVATNPVDIMTHLVSVFAAERGVPATRVLGSGTTLDTARFRTLIAAHVGVDARHVHGYVVGEHGDSEVLTWSQATIGGLSLEAYCQSSGCPWNDAVRSGIDERVRRAAYHIIAGKGATYYGIGAALARIVNVVLHDQRSILTVCSRSDEVAGVGDVTLSQPRMVGGRGVLATIPLSIESSEAAALQHSVQVVRRAIDELAQSGALTP
jgi:L-lactate dehydrogenase